MEPANLPTPPEALDALAAVRRVLGDGLIALYLHGSAVADGLRPQSDVDLLGVVRGEVQGAAPERLAAGLMKVSGRPGGGAGARPIELVIVGEADLRAPDPARRSLFVYGEWLREAFEAGSPVARDLGPDLTIVLAQARLRARALVGPHPADLLPPVSPDELRRAIRDAIPRLIADLDGDERNVLLTLARMWRTLATGEIVSKDAAAAWARPLLPAEAGALLSLAARGYLGGPEADWSARRQAVGRTVEALRARIVAAS